MNPDFLVIGAGVAGLRAAIELAEAGTVLVVAKDSLRESSSEYAQGGIAVALSDDDEVELHEQDTLYAGDGLCDRAAVRTLVEEGPAAIQQLIEWGAEFDREGTKLAFTREGAHSRNRVLHAHGDSTGREIARTLYHKARSLPNVDVSQLCGHARICWWRTACAGRDGVRRRGGSEFPIQARAVLLATGGLGRVFPEHHQSRRGHRRRRGDGVPRGRGDQRYRVRAVSSHRAARLEGAPRFLLSEALRGEGALLRNARGERFMERYHPLKELAPRDVVARAIVQRDDAHRRAARVSRPVRIAATSFIRERFPRIYETCLQLRRRISEREPAPVASGGALRDGRRADGSRRAARTCARLFAAGEAACTGVHGANRLASNSLLEGVVFGIRAGRAMREMPVTDAAGRRGGEERRHAETGGLRAGEIQRIAWEKCGIVRVGGRLAAPGLIERNSGGAARRSRPRTRNMQQVALLIARCALAREESRGAHFRDATYPRNARRLRAALAWSAQGSGMLTFR